MKRLLLAAVVALACLTPVRQAGGQIHYQWHYSPFYGFQYQTYWAPVYYPPYRPCWQPHFYPQPYSYYYFRW